MLLKRKAQSTAEYAIVIGLVIGAALAMQVYIKRSIAGGIKFTTDKLKGQSATATGQYEPYYLMSARETERSNVYSTEEFLPGGKVDRVTASETTPEKTDTTSAQVMRSWEDGVKD